MSSGSVEAAGAERRRLGPGLAVHSEEGDDDERGGRDREQRSRPAAAATSPQVDARIQQHREALNKEIKDD